MGKKLEAVVTSDWHLMSLAKHFRDHVERQLEEVEKIYQYAESNSIRHIFVVGDISDTPFMPYDVYYKLLLFMRKYDGLVNTYYIPGNHDFSDVSKTSLDLLNVLCREKFFSSLYLYPEVTTERIDGVRVNFLPYPCNEAPESKKPALNLSHVSYNGALNDTGRRMRVSDEFIQNSHDFNISGHIHQYQKLKSKRAIYNGSPFQKNFGESLPKGFIHIVAGVQDGRMRVQHKFVNNKPDFQLLNIIVKKRDDLKKLSTSDAYRYKLWVAPDVSLPSNLMTDYPNITGGVFDLESRKATKEVSDQSQEALSDPNANTINLRSGLKEFLRNDGLDKDQRKLAKKEIDKAISHLGL